MKALVIVTGRGLGGDASIALNLVKGLERNGVHCEIGLDESAPGLLFKKNGYDWHKITIPAAGGNVATKASALKAAFKMIPATFKIRRLIKKLNVDFVVGVIGGGAIVASVGGKVAGVPAFSLVCTPLDMKVCPKFNESFLLPESAPFKWKDLPKNFSKTYYPMSEKFQRGSAERAFEKLMEEEKFDPNKKTILFSSGSSIFKGVIEGANNFAEHTDEYNILLIGLPLHDEYLDDLNPDIIYLGYIDWLSDLFEYVELSIVTDDGITIQEAVSCEIPTVCLTRVKWGRYHDMAHVFNGATIEAEVHNLNEKIDEALANVDDLRANTRKYSPAILSGTDELAQKMIKKVEKNNG